MTHRAKPLVMLLACFFLSLLNAGIVDSVYAEQEISPDKIHGKVTDIINVTGYTYAEVDTGKEKVWAAGPVTPLKIGDDVAFSTGMPMENFHSKSMDRDFPILYFIDHFITDKDTAANESTALASPHGQIKQHQMAKPVKGIKKASGGNTIAEIHSQKQNLSGKTIRVRGLVTKFTAEVMGKNWLHIRDSSTLDDLTVTTASKVAIGDVVVVEGKLELDKDYSYGYVYPVILEDATVTKE